MFKKLSAIFGGGATVDTVLSTPQTHPGGLIEGEVRITGGTAELAVDRVELEIVAELETLVPFQQLHLGHRFVVAPGAAQAIPFALVVPWETPLTRVDGLPLEGVRVGVRTALDLAGALDKGDLDPVEVLPLPAQARLLDAFARLGFRLRGAALRTGDLHGARLPFFQEISYYPSRHSYAGELAVTFVSGPDSMDVLLEVDGLHDAYDRFTVRYAGAEELNWEQWLHEHLQSLSSRRSLFQ